MRTPPDPAEPVDLRRLPPFAGELFRRFGAGVDAAWPDEDFDRLALAAFAHQFDSIPAYAGFCERRGATPDEVSGWSAVPAVPAMAFKHLHLATDEPELVFRTSGTTRGDQRRGRHPVPSAALYRASLLPPFGKHVMAGRGRIRFVSLIPSPEEQPDSSLSFMVGAAAREYATEVHWMVDATGGLDDDGLRSVLGAAARADEPVLLLGTALALLHALEGWEDAPLEPLPAGSRIMETGGFKGATRSTTKAELHARLAERTGVSETCIVNEYGMTELLSQLYEPVLSEGPESTAVHVAPPWLRVRALDPVTLEALGPGEQGLLAFFDLANVGSVCHVLTEDLGAVTDGRVRLGGRSPGAEPRGCSRAMDELLTAARSAAARW